MFFMTLYLFACFFIFLNKNLQIVKKAKINTLQICSVSSPLNFVTFNNSHLKVGDNLQYNIGREQANDMW